MGGGVVDALTSFDFTGTLMKWNPHIIFQNNPFVCKDENPLYSAEHIKDFKSLAIYGSKSKNDIKCGSCLKIYNHFKFVYVVAIDRFPEKGLQISVENLLTLYPNSKDGTGTFDDSNFEIVDNQYCNGVFKID